MTSTKTQVVHQTYHRPYPPAALTSAEPSQEGKVADRYDAFIWELAKKFTNSPEEAEAAVQEMLLDIRRCEDRSTTDQPIELRVASLIGLRRLLRFLHLT